MHIQHTGSHAHLAGICLKQEEPNIDTCLPHNSQHIVIPPRPRSQGDTNPAPSSLPKKRRKKKGAQNPGQHTKHREPRRRCSPVATQVGREHTTQPHHVSLFFFSFFTLFGTNTIIPRRSSLPLASLSPHVSSPNKLVSHFPFSLLCFASTGKTQPPSPNLQNRNKEKLARENLWVRWTRRQSQVNLSKTGLYP